MSERRLVAALRSQVGVADGRGPGPMSAVPPRGSVAGVGLGAGAREAGVGLGAGRPGMASSEPMPTALLLELVAAVVQGGAPPEAALRSVGAALLEMGDQRGEGLLLAAGRVSGPAGSEALPAPALAGRLLAAVEESLLLATRSGLPPTALVRRAAVEERRRQLSEQLRAIRRLEVLLVIPAGLCLLPAFVLLGIVPLVIDLIAG